MVLNSIDARFILPNLSSYDNSPYRNQSRILSSREAHCLDLVEKAELDRLAKEISDKIHPNRPRSSINWSSLGRIILIIGGTVILTAANVASGGTLTPLQVALIAGASGAVIEGGSEILDELQDGEPINWGAVAARTVGGGAKGAMFSVPGLGTAKLAAGTVGIATAENYLHSAAKGDVSVEALGKALADGTIEGVTAGLVDVAAKKVLGAQPHAEPKPKPELQMEPMPDAELEATWGGASDPKWIPSEERGHTAKIRTTRGQLTGKLDGLTLDERQMVEDLLCLGENVEIIPRAAEPGVKTPDFMINGVKTELKTLNGTSLNTPVKRIAEGFSQGASTVIIDGRNTKITMQDAECIIERVLGKLDGKLPGTVEIWTNEGILRR